MKEILNSFEKSLERFEFTVELAWKAIQKFLREQKIICRSPKECLKEAFQFGLVKVDSRWLEMFEDRNLTVHTYDEKTADEIYNRLPNYLGILKLLKDGLSGKMA